MACWSDLNNDVFEHILRSLSLPDHHRCSAVCQNWRRVIKKRPQHFSPAPQLPWLMMREDASTKKRRFYSLTEKRHYDIYIPELHGQYWIGSSFGWLFIVDETFVPRLLNPFTREFYMPPALPRFEKKMLHGTFIKAILSNDPSKNCDFTVLLIYGRSCSKLAFWRRDENTWTCVPCEQRISDGIFFSGKFYLTTMMNILVIPDLRPNPKLIPVMPILLCGVKYLVDFMGQLLLVERHLINIGDRENLHMVTAGFKVHILNLEEKTSTHCMDFGDYAIFLGVCSPLVVDSTLFSVCKRNSIYFTDLDYKLFPEVYGCDDLGIYDLAKDATEPYYPRTVFHPYPERPIWLTPNSNKV